MEQALKTQAAFTLGYIAASAQGYTLEDQAIIAARSMAQSNPNLDHHAIIDALQIVLLDMSNTNISKPH